MKRVKTVRVSEYNGVRTTGLAELNFDENGISQELENEVADTLLENFKSLCEADEDGTSLEESAIITSKKEIEDFKSKAEEVRSGAAEGAIAVASSLEENTTELVSEDGEKLVVEGTTEESSNDEDVDKTFKAEDLEELTNSNLQDLLVEGGMHPNKVAKLKNKASLIEAVIKNI